MLLFISMTWSVYALAVCLKDNGGWLLRRPSTVPYLEKEGCSRELTIFRRISCLNFIVFHDSCETPGVQTFLLRSNARLLTLGPELISVEDPLYAAAACLFSSLF